MSNSYPLLAIARKHRVPYGHVLSYADFVAHLRDQGIATIWQEDAIDALPVQAKVEITSQVRDFEESRRRQT